jgi:hypothetical protein
MVLITTVSHAKHVKLLWHRDKSFFVKSMLLTAVGIVQASALQQLQGLTKPFWLLLLAILVMSSYFGVLMMSF